MNGGVNMLLIVGLCIGFVLGALLGIIIAALLNSSKLYEYEIKMSNLEIENKSLKEQVDKHKLKSREKAFEMKVGNIIKGSLYEGFNKI